jgi:hypothetical protein
LAVFTFHGTDELLVADEARLALTSGIRALEPEFPQLVATLGDLLGTGRVILKGQLIGLHLGLA